MSRAPHPITTPQTPEYAAKQRREHVRANPNGLYVVKGEDQGRKGVMLKDGYRIARFDSLLEARAIAETLNEAQRPVEASPLPTDERVTLDYMLSVGISPDRAAEHAKAIAPDIARHREQATAPLREALEYGIKVLTLTRDACEEHEARIRQQLTTAIGNMTDALAQSPAALQPKGAGYAVSLTQDDMVHAINRMVEFAKDHGAELEYSNAIHIKNGFHRLHGMISEAITVATASDELVKRLRVIVGSDPEKSPFLSINDILKKLSEMAKPASELEAMVGAEDEEVATEIFDSCVHTKVSQGIAAGAGFNTAQCAAILARHRQQAAARATTGLTSATRDLLKHLEANFHDTDSIWVKQAEAALSSATQRVED